MTLYDFFIHTPAWVFAVFTYLLIIGIKALKADTVKIYRLALPVYVFIFWGLYSINNNYGVNAPIIILFIALLTLGILFGQKFLCEGITRDRKKLTAHIPGSAYPLVFYMSFFCIKYFLGYTYAIDPSAKLECYWMLDVAASAFIAGIFLGRYLYITRKS